MKVLRGSSRARVPERWDGGRRRTPRPAAVGAVQVVRHRARRLAGRARRALKASAPWLATRSTGAARWLPPGLTLDDFFGVLRRAGVTYVVLRWFEELPRVERGHDVDLLVADEDVGFVHSLLADRPHWRSQHLDVYSVCGMPGSDLDGLACFPRPLADAMLTSAVWHRGRYRVPDLEAHFLGLAYHAAYHKGYASGLRSEARHGPAGRHASHDYETVLVDLAGRLGETVTPTLDGVDRYLAGRGLRPSPDVLERLAVRNPWVRDRFLRGSRADSGGFGPGTDGTSATGDPTRGPARSDDGGRRPRRSPVC